MADDPRDANGYKYDQYPAARIAKEQAVANVSWPFKDSKGQHARGIPDQPADNQRPVWVRLVLADDGEVVLPGRATRWNASHVYVVVDDHRVPQRAVWVLAADVRRRED